MPPEFDAELRNLYYSLSLQFPADYSATVHPTELMFFQTVPEKIVYQGVEEENWLRCSILEPGNAERAIFTSFPSQITFEPLFSAIVSLIGTELPPGIYLFTMRVHAPTDKIRLNLEQRQWSTRAEIWNGHCARKLVERTVMISGFPVVGIP